MTQKIRIDKFLADQNIGSRKEVSILIRKGRVKVNELVVKNIDYKVTPDDQVTLDDAPISYSKYIYIMMNKPTGVVSATSDKVDKTVIDLVPAEFFRKDLFPSGRLDKDTTGLMLITNDGDFSHKMLSPKYKVYKHYRAVLDYPINEDDVKAFKKGVNSFLPAKLWVEEADDKNIAHVLVCEGKFHQIKRMFYARQKNVVKLERLAIGSLMLDEKLKFGECKLLNKEDLDLIFL